LFGRSTLEIITCFEFSLRTQPTPLDRLTSKKVK
jgi:hypothetical protein